MTRPITATIRLSALRENLATARSLAPRSSIWAVVKADAYGHGLLPATTAFAAADGLALVEFEAAIRLRGAGWSRSILMLEGAFGSEDVGLAARLGLSLVVHDVSQLPWLQAALPAPLDIFLKINTGMNRLGIPVEQVRPLYRRLVELPSVRSICLMTHFANADLPGGADQALLQFDRAVDGLPAVHSLANSAALFSLPGAHRDWVRPGIMLYGASPFAERSAQQLGLRASMRLHSRLIGVQHLQAGDAVGYGSAFVAPHPMRIGIVAGGYADGYPRHAPTGTPVAVDGVRTRTVGRVSMDMLAVDLQGIQQAGVGTEVELWGDQVPIDEVAAHAGTIAYELMCALAPRVRREVIGLGESLTDPV